MSLDSTLTSQELSTTWRLLSMNVTGLQVKTVHRFPISLLELKQYGRREVKDAENG